MDVAEEVVHLISKMEEYQKIHRLEFYNPYEFQKKFHHVFGEGDFVPVKSDKNKSHLAIMRALQCANQIGKSTSGETPRKAVVPNAFEICLVKHASGGWSKIYLKPYEQGAKKFMGYRLHGFWDDEEPPEDILSQQKRATLSTDGIGYLTYTPEDGITRTVHQIMYSRNPGEALITATWDDAPHMTPDKRRQSLLKFPEHEREMGSQGKPMIGTGMVYPVDEGKIIIDPFATAQ